MATFLTFIICGEHTNFLHTTHDEATTTKIVQMDWSVGTMTTKPATSPAAQGLHEKAGNTASTQI